jgi:hypothetical protein
MGRKEEATDAMKNEGGRPKATESRPERGVPAGPATALRGVKPGDIPEEGAVGHAEPKAPSSGVVADVASTPLGIRSLWPGHLRVTGEVTGRIYDWPSAGSITAVERDDVPGVLARNHSGRRACCGGSGERRYFEPVN